MTALQSRLFAASLVCVTISGCASSGVGTPLPSGGATRFLLYAPPDAQLALSIHGVTGNPLIFAPDPAYDNAPSRPFGTPDDHVAFTTLHHLNGDGTYEADLKSWSPLTQNYEFVDTVDRFSANTLVLIKQD